MAPGVSAKAQASTTPGKPPPLPRSAQTFASGAIVTSCSESAICRVHRLGSVDGATSWFWPATPGADRHSGRAAPLFHVKRASAPTPRLCRRRSRGCRQGRCLGHFAGSSLTMSSSRLGSSEICSCSAQVWEITPPSPSDRASAFMDDVRFSVALFHVKHATRLPPKFCGGLPVADRPPGYPTPPVSSPRSVRPAPPFAGARLRASSGPHWKALAPGRNRYRSGSAPRRGGTHRRRRSGA